jgi:hypothetical protein
MQLPLNASVDAAIRGKKYEVLPFAMEILKHDSSADGKCRKKLVSKLIGNGLYMVEEDLDLLLSFDPKSCRIPHSYCCANCEECPYNPLDVVLIPYTEEKEDFTFVITRQDIIDALLDTINMLAKAYSLSIGRM